MAAIFPGPETIRPVALPDGTVHAGTVFLKPVIEHPNIAVGDYSYASDFDPPVDPADWAGRLAPYLYPGAPERLVIGKFCQIAHGVRFVTASANHRMDGVSTYPFPIFTPARMADYAGTFAHRPDTVIGNDVWIGMNAIILPGARLGDGVIVGAGAVVGGDVPDYAIVSGNRATVTRMRFAPETIVRLKRIAWWNWPIDRILAHEEAITGADVGALELAGT